MTFSGVPESQVNPRYLLAARLCWLPLLYNDIHNFRQHGVKIGLASFFSKAVQDVYNHIKGKK